MATKSRDGACALKRVRKAFAGSGSFDVNTADAVIWGIPTDRGAGSNRLGASEGPRVIREASRIWNTVRTSSGFPFPLHGKVVDLGDVDFTDIPREETYNRIIRDMPEYDSRRLTVMLGGDHSVTIPVLKKDGRRWGMIYLDAHPDAIEAYRGDRFSHACTLKRVIESGHVAPEHTVILGMRAPEAEEVEFLRDRNIKFFSAWDVQQLGIGEVCSQTLEIVSNLPVYLSIDMDVMDASHVPGVQNPEPGGLSSREVIYACTRFSPYIQACDIVEVTAQRDPAGITAIAAARIALDIAGTYIQGRI